MNYVINPFTPIPRHAKSHVRGWAQYWAEVLGAEVLHKGELDIITKNDVVYIDHGANFGGTLNLFGGVADEMVKDLLGLIQKNPKIYSLDIKMPEYAAMLAKRIGQNTCSKSLTRSILNKLSGLLSKAPTVDWQKVGRTGWVCIGDSHSTAYARPRSPVCKMNGQLLYTAEPILDGLRMPKKLHGITLCLGSVDIRHHIYRQRRPLKSLEALVYKYLDMGEKLANKHDCEVEFGMPVPIEFEDRRIPKSGFYNGTPFYGSLKQRRKATSDFIMIARDSGCEIVMPPAEWYTMDPQEYANNCMELSSSVHISPTHYRSKGGWDV